MRKLALVAFFLSHAAFAMEPDLAVGVEGLAHLQRQVNPDFADGVLEPALFGKLRFHPVAIYLELGYAPAKTSSSGNLSVSTSTFDVTAWGHWEFDQPGNWTPYLGVGLGGSFDNVKTSFAGTSSSDNGYRFRMGAALGVSKSFSWFLLEVEGRGELVEYSTRPDLTALFRFGYLFY